MQKCVILPNFLVYKFCGKAQFPLRFGRIARNSAETVPFHKTFLKTFFNAHCMYPMYPKITLCKCIPLLKIP